MLTRKLFFLPLILLFISCTVTKRVHRPGFHVQWHKVQRTQAPEKAEKTVQIAAQPENPTKDNVHFGHTTERLDSTQIESAEIAENSVVLSTKTTKTVNFKRILSIPEDLQIEAIQKKTTEHQKISSHQQSRPIFWRISAKNLRFIGLFFIWFGGLLLFGSFLVYAGAFSGNGAGAWANFFFDLISISNWFWFLVFILLLILVMYIATVLVRYVFGGPLIASIIGLSLLIIGILFYILGKRREIEP